MPVEVAKLVDDFNKLWPRGTDSVSKADDHIRMIKEVLQLEFELLYNKTRVFSFEKGAVVTPDCILYYEAEKAFYHWNGAYDVNNKYIVNAGSTPETAGGISGNAWTRSTGSGFMSTVLVSDTEPTAPFQNMLWWDTNSGMFFIYYNDGTSTQWVDLFGIADQASFNTLLFRSILARLAAESGYTLVGGSFQEGAISSGFSDVVLDWNTAKFYQWHLNENKVVPVGSTPETAGGVGIGAWVDRTNDTLRSEMLDAGGIRMSSACKSISELLSLSSPVNGQRVDVLGFYTDNLRGGGTFRFRSSVAKSTHNGITVISPTVPFSGLGADASAFLSGTGETDPSGSGCWVRVSKNSWLETAMAGCVIDGVFDDAPLCQKLHNIGYHVEYSPGYYNFGSSVIPKPGQKIFSQGVGYWNINPIRNVKITNNVVGGKIFDYSSDTSYGQVDAPDIEGLYLIADYPVYLNPHSGFIRDGASATFPYLMKPRVRNCVLKARSTGVGFGIAATKCFDGDFSGNDITNFAYNIFLHGSDLNKVNDNRLVGATEYQILEQSAQTFGTQNDIYHNDILASGPSCVYIKSRSRQPLIHDNYLEQTSSCKGFIDISSSDGITFGSNVSSVPYYTFVDNNRIDGHALATDFVYRLEPTGISVVLRDPGTTGVYATDDKELKIVGAMAPNLPYLYSQAKAMFYDISSPAFKRFNSFKTSQLSNKVEITAQNLAHATNNNFYANRADLHISTDGQSIILDATCSSAYMQLRPDASSGLNNVNFPSGATITATIWAKTDSASGDTLVVNRMLNNGGSGTSSNLVLTQQFQKFTYTFSGSSSSDLIGLYFVRSTNNAAISIRKIEFN